jgi:hypothetical protein
MLDATPETASNLALRIQAAVAATPLPTGRVHLSIGVCTSTGGEPDLIREVADDALYAAKAGGGAKTVVHDLRSEVYGDVLSGRFSSHTSPEAEEGGFLKLLVYQNAPGPWMPRCRAHVCAAAVCVVSSSHARRSEAY